MNFKVKLWGVRGSLPSPLAPDALLRRFEVVLQQYEKLREAQVEVSARAFLETLPIHVTRGYGGNTTCAELTCQGDRLLIDAGSGLRAFSEWVVQSEPTTNEFHIYFTHFHWDHLIGLPFFVPLYGKGKTVHFYSPDDQLEASLRTLFKKPNFPVPFEVISKQIKIHKLTPHEKSKIGAFEVTPYKLDHPDPCWGLRVEAMGKSVAWAVDNEGTRVSREDLGRDIGLYTKADLLVYDAQYTFDEALDRINWGHSSAPIGLDLALREEIKQTLFVHHDPNAQDYTIRAAEEQTQTYFDELLRQRRRSGLPAPELLWRFAREGEVIEV